MTDRLKVLRERSHKRRQLLAKQFGVTSDSLGRVLKSKDEQSEESRSSIKIAKVVPTEDVINQPIEGSDEKKKTAEDFEDTLYSGSDTFLKGLQSANPHNDYCQNFVDTGHRPQNFIRDVGLRHRFEEYPKLRELIKLKDDLIRKTATTPMYLHCDFETFDFSELDNRFDVIYIDPPLEEYQRSNGVHFDKYWGWEEIEQLEIEKVAAQRSFIWLWCGNGDGLDWGRKCLKRWGYRRCEDICWIKTNIKNPGHNKNQENKSVLQRTKAGFDMAHQNGYSIFEANSLSDISLYAHAAIDRSLEHCLMGIKGTVRRSTDGDFIHANVDIDLIIDEEPEYGSKEKTPEIFKIMEHFCLGRRRLHVFGRDSNIRPGWLTIGPEVTSSNFDAEQYTNYFNKTPDGYLSGCTDEIEKLRPKSPVGKTRGGGPGGRGGPSGGMPYRGSFPRGGGPSRGMGPRGGGRGDYRGRGGFRGRGGYRGGYM